MGLAAGPPAHADRLRAVAGTGVSGVVVVTGNIALGALLFGADPALIPSGIAVSLWSSVILGLVVALRGSVPGTIAASQDSPTILLALSVGSVMTAGAAMGPQRSATAFAVVLVATAASGAVSYLVGLLRLGALLRFVPFPVVGGFLAGTGWLLVAGSIEFLTGKPLDLRDLGNLAEPAAVVRWLPPFIVAGVLLRALERGRRPMLLPAVLVGFIGAFYAGWALGGQRPAEAMARGWLLGPFPQGSGWRPDPWGVVAEADWGLVVGEVGTIASIALVVLVSVVLSTSGLELALRADPDIDRELRANGLGNVLSGLTGGSIGYTSLADTVLARTLGLRGRGFAVGVAVLSAAALLVGTAPLAWFPTPVVGVVLFLLGLSFLNEWVLRARRRMPLVEHAVVLVILAVIALFGFLWGVAAGIALATLLFVVAASRVDVVKHEMSATQRASHVDRPRHERERLRNARGHAHVLVLQGFLFFGTSHSVAHRLLQRLDDPQAPQLRYAVVDLRLVNGLDSSAVFSFSKVRRRLAAQGAVLVLSSVPPDAQRALAAGGLLGGDGLVICDSLDHALEWCEDELLGAADRGLAVVDVSDVLRPVLPEGADASAIIQRLELRTLDAGQHLISQGHRSGGLHFVVSGVLSVERTPSGGGPPLRLRLLRAGAVTGELSYYLGQPAGASVVAATPVTVARLSDAAVRDLESEVPDLAAALHRLLVRTVAERLAESNRAVEALLR